MNTASRNELDVELSHVLARWWRVVENWNLSPEEEALLLGVALKSGERLQNEVETRIRILIELDSMLSDLCDTSGQVGTWLRRPLPRFEHRSPMQFMSESLPSMRLVRDVLRRGLS